MVKRKNSQDHSNEGQLYFQYHPLLFFEEGIEGLACSRRWLFRAGGIRGSLKFLDRDFDLELHAHIAVIFLGDSSLDRFLTFEAGAWIEEDAILTRMQVSVTFLTLIGERDRAHELDHTGAVGASYDIGKASLDTRRRAGTKPAIGLRSSLFFLFLLVTFLLILSIHIKAPERDTLPKAPSRKLSRWKERCVLFEEFVQEIVEKSLGVL